MGDISDWLSEEHHNAYVFMTSLLDLNGDSYPEIICAHNVHGPPTDMTILFNVPDGAGGRT